MRASRWARDREEESITFKLNCKIFQNSARLTKFTNYKITHNMFVSLFSSLSLSFPFVVSPLTVARKKIHAKGIYIFCNGFCHNGRCKLFEENYWKSLVKNIIDEIWTSEKKAIVRRKKKSGG